MQTKHAISALSSLAQETRLEIFRLLVKCGPEGFSAGVIAERLRAAPATMSFHMAHLIRAGLIDQRRGSRSLIYTANFDGMDALVNYLTENCCVEQECKASSKDRASTVTERPRARQTAAK
jgi:DNA-binding transcriptional ArsR family regulator